jgi:predicted transcriptional regulator
MAWHAVHQLLLPLLIVLRFFYRVPLVEASIYTGPHIDLVDVVKGEEPVERAANMLQRDLAAVQEAIDKVLYCGLLAAE